MVVPFGQSNSSSIFMFLMNGVFREYLDNFLIMFLDGILIHSNSEEEHEKHLRILLQFLREHKLYAKLSRCIFYQKKIHYLGHIIFVEGIIVDPEKIEAIIGWPMPRSII